MGQHRQGGIGGNSAQQQAQGRKGGVTLNEGELSESVGGTFGRLTLCNTATSQEQLDRNHSKAQNFKEEWEGKTMQIGVCSV